MAGTRQDIDDLANFLNAQANPRSAAALKPLLTAPK